MQKTSGIAIALSLPSAMAADGQSVTLEDKKRAQDPFEFYPLLDYRQFGMLDVKGADLEDVAVYQVRYTHPVAETS